MARRRRNDPPPAQGDQATNPEGGEAPAAAPAGRRRNGGVVGPTSALTSFLREHGIQTSVGRSGWSQNPQAQADPSTESPTPGPSSPNASGVGTPESNRKRQTRGGGDDDDMDSDDLDDDASNKRTKVDSGTGTGATTPVNGDQVQLKGVGEFMNCSECGTQFTVTAYTKGHPSKPGYLCYECTLVFGIDPLAKAKKKPVGKRAPAARDKRNKIVAYEEIKGVLPLGDLCIKLIGKYIEDVEALGNIGAKSMDKVCRIISKSRRLTADTATLFYAADRTELRMYDCTNLVPASYVTLAALCPNLKDLSLELCGQLNTDTLIKWGQVLTDLRRLELWGPFNVREEGWLKFFDSVGDRLEGFVITQTPRFNFQCLQSLVRNCPNLKELRMREFGLIDDRWMEEIGKLVHLEHLDISAPGTRSCTDEPVIKMLSTAGSKLESLSLEDHNQLTDKVLHEGILKYCPRLVKLGLGNIADYAPPQEEEEHVKTGLTDQGVASFFAAWKQSGHPGLVDIDLKLNYELVDASLVALLDHSGQTLEDLNIKGWRELSKEALGAIGSKCPNLKRLDVGWCRQLTDYTLKDILQGCPKLEVVKAWGCNKLTDNVPRKKGCRVTGIESHTIAA